MKADLRLNWCFTDENNIGHVEVISSSVGSLMGSPVCDFPIDEKLATALMLGFCAGCHAAIVDLATPCKCGHRSQAGGHLDIEFDDSQWRDYSKAFDAFVKRKRSAVRRNAAKPESDPLRVEDVSLLLHLQDGLCFYCALPFQVGKHGPIFEREHYVPIRKGGKDVLENVVLACPSCNNKKGMWHGYRFECLMRRKRDSSLGPRYAKMRKKFRDYFNDTDGEHLALIGGYY